MESNIYIVDFTNDYFVQTLQKSLVQWNYGQILRIQGLHLPSAVEIHFSLQETGGEAEVRIGVTKDGVTDVQIPDFVFENKGALRDYTAYAFIYPSDIYSGETIHKIVLNVKARPKPKGFVTPSDEDLFHKTLEEINNAMNKTEGFSKVSESYAKGGTGIRLDEDTDNSKYYAQKADESAKSIIGIEQVVKESAQKVADDVKQVELTKQAVDKTATGVVDTENRINQTKQEIDLIQQNVQVNKDAVDTAKQAVDLAQADVTKKAEQVTKDAQQVATDKGIVEQAKANIGNKIQEHNVSPLSHADIRSLINGLTTRLNALADSDDESLDQLSEIVAYIKSNKTLIENVTTNKVNVADIVDNLSTNVPNKPLSASMGVELKRLIDLLDKELTKKVDKTEQEQKDLVQDKAIQVNKDDIFKTAIKPQVQGNPLVLKDSADFKAVELEVNGSTSQITTTGTNMLDPTKLDGKLIPLNIKAGVYFNLFTDGTPSKGGNLKLQYEDGSIQWVAIDSGKTQGSHSVLSQNIVGYYNILVDKENMTKHHALVFDNGEQKSIFEPYTGGKPSPSPEYPQEIVNGVVDSVGCNGENLFVPPKEIYKSVYNNYPTMTIMTDGLVSIKGVVTVQGGRNTIKSYSFILKKGTYNVSYKGIKKVNLYLVNEDTNDNEVTNINGGSFTLVKDTTLHFGLNAEKEDIGKTIDEEYYIQLELGSQATEYEPYKGFTSPIPPIELSKWDKIKKIDGVWKKENNSGKHIVTNVFYFKEDKIAFVINDMVRIPITSKKERPVYINNFKQNYNAWHKNEIGFITNEYNMVISYPTVFTSKEKAEEWFKSNRTEVFYRTDSPTYEILPQETQEVLNKIQTFYPNSTIQTNEGIELNLKYIADTKNYIDNEIAEIKKAIVATGGV